MAGVLLLRQARALLAASHPLPTLAVTSLVGLLAAAWGRGPGGTALVVLAVGTGQLSVGWCNDAVDAERDAAVGRTDKPVVAGRVSRRTTAVAAGAALAACIVLSLANGRTAGVVHLIGVGAAWAYDLVLKRTAWSWLPYAVGFGSLPAFVVLGLPGSPAPAWWVVLAAALVGVGAHFANVLPDLLDDAATGVRGLPHRLGAPASRVLSVGCLVAAVVTLTVAPPGSPPALAVVALVVVVGLGVLGVRTSARPGDRSTFRATVAAAAVAVGLLLTLPVPTA